MAVDRSRAGWGHLRMPSCPNSAGPKLPALEALLLQLAAPPAACPARGPTCAHSTSTRPALTAPPPARPPARRAPQLADSSPLKRELVEGVDILIVRELVGGIYFGQPRVSGGALAQPPAGLCPAAAACWPCSTCCIPAGAPRARRPAPAPACLCPQGFGTNEKGEKTGFNTDVYSESEVERIARVAFDAARKRNKRLCSVEKSNVLEVRARWRAPGAGGWGLGAGGWGWHGCRQAAPAGLRSQLRLRCCPGPGGLEPASSSGSHPLPSRPGPAQPAHLRAPLAAPCPCCQVSQLWKEVVIRVGQEYPDVELSHMYIDNAAMQMIRNPKWFDTIVTGEPPCPAFASLLGCLTCCLLILLLVLLLGCLPCSRAGLLQAAGCPSEAGAGQGSWRGMQQARLLHAGAPLPPAALRQQRPAALAPGLHGRRAATGLCLGLFTPGTRPQPFASGTAAPHASARQAWLPAALCATPPFHPSSSSSPQPPPPPPCRQHLWRHPVGRGLHAGGLPGHAPLRLHQQRRPGHLRAGARLCARHCGPGHRQPAGHGAERRHDVPLRPQHPQGARRGLGWA
jgi:hypothetical protein